MKSGKSCGLDGLSSENFKFASRKLSMYLTLVYNCMITHGHVSEKFMLTMIVPIVKDKKSSITVSDNYRPIAITNVASKIVEIILLTKYKENLRTRNNQVGFKPGLGRN